MGAHGSLQGPPCDAQSEDIWAQADVGLDDAVSFTPCTGCPRLVGARITGELSRAFPGSRGTCAQEHAVRCVVVCA